MGTSVNGVAKANNYKAPIVTTTTHGHTVVNVVAPELETQA